MAEAALYVGTCVIIPFPRDGFFSSNHDEAIIEADGLVDNVMPMWMELNEVKGEDSVGTCIDKTYQAWNTKKK